MRTPRPDFALDQALLALDQLERQRERQEHELSKLGSPRRELISLSARSRKCNHETLATTETMDDRYNVRGQSRASQGTADLDLRDPAILTELKPIALFTSSSMFDT